MSKIVGVITACLMCIAILEGLVRWMRPIPPLPSATTIGWTAEASPYKWSPYVDRHFLDNTRAEVNQLSLRGRPFPPGVPGKIRILLVGDSQVEAGALPYADLPEILLEDALNRRRRGDFVEVRGVASSGWGQDQELLALNRYYKEFDAEYIVLWFTPQNDFWENAFPDRATAPYLGPLKPTFILQRDGLKPFPYSYKPTVANEIFGDFHLYRVAFRALEKTGLLGQSQILSDFNNMIPSPRGHRTADRQKCPRTVLEQGMYVRDLATYSSRAVSIETQEDIPESRSNFAPFLAAMSERDQYLVMVTQALIRRMALLADENGAKLVVFFNNQTWRGASNDALRVGGCVMHADKWYETVNMVPVVKHALAEFQPIELTASHGDIGLDEATVARDDRHLNTLGNRRVLEELAGVMSTNLGDERKARTLK